MYSQDGSLFRKTAACPTTKRLLAYKKKQVARSAEALIRLHLADCEFCNAELLLLAFHEPMPKRRGKAPEIPINLRILAESLLSHSSRLRKEVDRVKGLQDYKMTV